MTSEKKRSKSRVWTLFSRRKSEERNTHAATNIRSFLVTPIKLTEGIFKLFLFIEFVVYMRWKIHTFFSHSLSLASYFVSSNYRCKFLVRARRSCFSPKKNELSRPNCLRLIKFNWQSKSVFFGIAFYPLKDLTSSKTTLKISFGENTWNIYFPSVSVVQCFESFRLIFIRHKAEEIEKHGKCPGRNSIESNCPILAHSLCIDAVIRAHINS